jgi:hypothetical protein
LAALAPSAIADSLAALDTSVSETAQKVNPYFVIFTLVFTLLFTI